LQELESSISRILNSTNTPGAGVAVISGDEIRWIKGIGLANVSQNRETTADSFFRIGSISKMFVGLAVLQLVEKGQLRLEDKLSDLAPEVEFRNPWEDTDPIRLVHLLEHTTGFDDIHLREYAHQEPHPLSLEEALAFGPSSRVSRWKPGTHFSYCNSGPAVAAYLVEKKTGSPFDKYVQDNLFSLLGMDSASFFLDSDVQENLALGYGPDGVTELPYWHVLMWPAGSINASANSMANFLEMFLRRGQFEGKTIVTSDSLIRMETPATPLSAQRGMRMGYGLANFTSTNSGFLFHGHDGGMNSYLSKLAYLPNRRAGYVVMINSANGRALNEISGKIEGFLTRDLEPPRGVPQEVPAERITALSRYYEPVTPRQEVFRFIDRLLGVIRVDYREGTLDVRPIIGDRQTLIPVTDRRFKAEEEPIPSAIFMNSPDGQVILQGYGTLAGNYRSVPAGLLWLQWVLAAVSLLLMGTSLLFSLAWVPRKLLGRLSQGYLAVRVIPLLAALSFTAAFSLLFLSGTNELIQRFGNLTLWSAAFYLLLWIFPVLSLAGLFQSIRSFRWPVTPGVRAHSLAVSAANLLVAFYLSYWGITGLATWSY
jgi:CubicO group peptidase (beta-lactamase class C family)